MQVSLINQFTTVTFASQETNYMWYRSIGCHRVYELLAERTCAWMIQCVDYHVGPFILFLVIMRLVSFMTIQFWPPCYDTFCAKSRHWGEYLQREGNLGTWSWVFLKDGMWCRYKKGHCQKEMEKRKINQSWFFGARWLEFLFWVGVLCFDFRHLPTQRSTYVMRHLHGTPKIT